MNQCFVPHCAQFIVVEIDVFEPVGLIRFFDKGFESEEVVNSPWIEDVGTEVEVSVFIKPFVGIDFFLGFGAELIDTLRK